MEYNFSLFFGLAVQAYERRSSPTRRPSTTSSGTPWGSRLSDAAERGRRIFFNIAPGPQGGCRFCHSGSLLSEASVDSIAAAAGWSGAREGS